MALAFLTLAGAAHLALRTKDLAGLHSQSVQLEQARQERARERGELLKAHDRLAALRRDIEPVVTLNGKLASLTNLSGEAGQQRGVGSVAMTGGGAGDEKRLGRQLAAMSMALIEEIAFQRTRQKQLESILHERALEFAARPSIWPVHGAINSNFGYRYMGRARDFHKGLDIGVPVGSPVVAPADGKVVEVGYEHGYGLMVVIEHRHGVSTIYAHLKSAMVEPGDEVARGVRIAYSGMSGRTTGSHLHYEVRVNGQAVDPMNYMLD